MAQALAQDAQTTHVVFSLLRVLAARDARKSRGHVVAAAGRVAVNGAPRPRDWRSRCAFLAAGDARCDGFLSLSARETVALTPRSSSPLPVSPRPRALRSIVPCWP